MSFEEAVSAAALSQFGGKRHPHQRRLSKTTLLEAETRLLAVRQKLKEARSFDELHTFISSIFGPLKGAGRLYMYDVAIRIGVNLSLEPVYVYLHAGSRIGAQHLGVRGEKALLSAFPESIQRLTAAQAEDFLCIYKKRIASVVAMRG